MSHTLDMHNSLQSVRHARKGFTLIELMVAIVVIGILLAGSLALINMVQERGAKAGTLASLRSLKVAIMNFEADTKKYPNRLNDLVKKPSGEEFAKWDGPYIKEVPLDGWKGSFKYKTTPGSKHPYELYAVNPNNVKYSVWDE
jgi:type II secretion system protein G